MPDRAVARGCLGAVVAVLAARDAAAQPAPPAAPPAGEAPRLLGPDPLHALLAPFARAPQLELGLGLGRDACRTPADLMAAAAWLWQPEATRGPPSPGWPPAVRMMAERAFGTATAGMVRAMRAFDPGPGWTRVDPAAP